MASDCENHTNTDLWGQPTFAENCTENHHHTWQTRGAIQYLVVFFIILRVMISSTKRLLVNLNHHRLVERLEGRPIPAQPLITSSPRSLLLSGHNHLGHHHIFAGRPVITGQSSTDQHYLKKARLLRPLLL